jgi:hypothetical protein
VARETAGTVTIENSDPVFELHGVDEFLSLKRSIRIPLDHVVSVSTERVPWKPFKQLRVVGAFLPGVVKDERFLSSDGLMFFEMHDPDKCITANLDHERYKKIVLKLMTKKLQRTISTKHPSHKSTAHAKSGTRALKKCNA